VVKRTLAIDVLALAGLYTMRILAGGADRGAEHAGFLKPARRVPALVLLGNTAAL